MSGRLNATKIRNIREPGTYGDGQGLLLVVRKSSASWILRTQKGGRRRDIGIGSLSKVPLADARQRAQTVRQQIEAGKDPIVEKKRLAGIPTFRVAAGKVHTEHRPGWRNSKHGQQWLRTLETYAFPSLGNRSVADIGAQDVRDLLAPIWLEKPETARRVLQRVRLVLDWAVAKQYRSDELQQRAVMRGLPKQPKNDGHFAAMPYEELPAFMAALRSGEAITRLALEFLILTAARSGEVRGARWSEIDEANALWTIPAGRMKAGREHVVPLSQCAARVLERAKLQSEGDEFIFPGFRAGSPLSDMSLTKFLRDQDLPFTVHGFRSSFRDWAAEQSAAPGEVVERALAHTIRDKTEAAYFRSSLLQKRRALMEEWGLFCKKIKGCAKGIK